MAGRFFLLLFGIFFFGSDFSLAQGREWIQLGIEDGLNSEEVYSLRFDEKGYLWAFTELGVVRHNGIRFEAVPGFPANSSVVYAWSPDGKGGYFMYNSAGQLGHYQQDTFRILPVSSQLKQKTVLKNQLVYKLLSDQNGRIWLQTTNQLFSFDPSSGILQDHFPKDSFEIQISPVRNEAVFASGAGFQVISVDRTFLERFRWISKTRASKTDTLPFFLEKDHHRSFGFRLGNNWILAIGKRLYRQDNRGNFQYLNFNSLFIKVLPDGKNGFWVSTYRNGIMHLDASFRVIENLFPDLSVSDLITLPDGRLVVSTLESGVFYEKYPGIRRTRISAGDPVGFIQSVGNSLFFGASQGRLFSIHKNGKTQMARFPVNIGSNHRFTGILPIQGNKLLLCGSSGSFLVDSSLEHPSYILDSDTRNPTVALDFTRLPNGEVFGSTRRGLGKLDGTILHRFSTSYFPTRDLAFAGNQIYQSTDFGLLVYRVEKPYPVPQDTLFNGLNVKRLKTLPSGIWASVLEKGIYHQEKNGNWKPLSGLMPKPYVFDFDFQGDSVLYLATASGLWRGRFELKDFAVSQLEPMLDNMVTQVKCWNDSIWIGTRNGLLVCASGSLPNLESQLWLRKFECQGKPLPFAQGIQLSSEVNQIRFSFDFLHSLDRKPVLQYRLKGSRQLTGTLASRDLRFQDLPFGSYELVLSSEHAGKDGKAKTWIFRFEVEQAFYEKTWFRLIAGLVFLLVLGLVVWRVVLYYRNRDAEANRLQQMLTSYKVTALQTQMNPHFISNALTAIQNLILSREHQRANDYLTKFSRMLRWVLDFSDRQWISLEEELSIIRINVELEQLRFTDSFEFRFEKDPGIKEKEVLIPTLITQPFVENAIWHGLLPLKNRPARLYFGVYDLRENLMLVIEDNGVGRSQQDHSGDPRRISKGSKLAEDRLRHLNDWLGNQTFRIQIIDLKDENGQASGTRIEITIPRNLHGIHHPNLPD